MAMRDNLYLGIDVGTSGCRTVLIDEQSNLVAEHIEAMPEPLRAGPVCEQSADIWWTSLQNALHGLSKKHDLQQVRSLAVDATSGSTLLVDNQGEPLCNAMMYSDTRSREQAEVIATLAPSDSGAHGPTSGLAKSLFMMKNTGRNNVARILSQADWLVFKLTGRLGLSDENNALKLGYDPVDRCWPHWISELKIPHEWLPHVCAPGTPLAPLLPELADELGLPKECMVVAGTTDSTAGFLATDAALPGDAVTSLGSSLVVKILSETPVFAPEYGVYSHRIGNLWLVGGASNSGGAVLRRYFSQEQLDAMTSQVRPEQPTDLQYYPLLTTGERFPINDPDFAPRLSPRPEDDVRFFQGMLEGIAMIEAQSYIQLQKLGAPTPRSIRSIGGGARNKAWSTIRSQYLETPMPDTGQREPAYGSALLALQGAEQALRGAA